MAEISNEPLQQSVKLFTVTDHEHKCKLCVKESYGSKTENVAKKRKLNLYQGNLILWESEVITFMYRGEGLNCIIFTLYFLLGSSYRLKHLMESRDHKLFPQLLELTCYFLSTRFCNLLYCILSLNPNFRRENLNEISHAFLRRV
jgi:hypothetical protein